MAITFIPGTKHLYQDCEDTTLDIWLNIIKTGDLKLLVKKGMTPKKEILVAQMEKINQEFMSLRGENNTLTQFDKIQYKEQLELKVQLAVIVLGQLTKRSDLGLLSAAHLEKYVARFKKLGFRINRDNPLNEELSLIISELNALQTTIKVLHEELYPEVEEDTTAEEQKMFEFHSMLLSYSRILRIDDIDTKKTTLMKFVVIEKQVEQAMKQNQNPTK